MASNIQVNQLTELNNDNFLSVNFVINEMNASSIEASDEILESNDDNQKLFEMNLNEEHSKEDLAAAALSFFFAGKMTQEHFSKCMKFFNLTSKIKIPTTFSSLKKLITDQAESISFEKQLFCKNCNEHVQYKRYKRNCEHCNYK